MKKVLLLLMTIAMVAMSASATKIYVCGTKITGTTSFSAAGGTVSYNNSSRTLTISNVNYTKTGSSNNGISVDEVDGPLTINLTSTFFDIKDADAVLCKSGKATTINVNDNCAFICRSQSHAGLKLQDGDVTVNGNYGQLSISNTANGNAIKGGAGTENLTLQIKVLNIYSNNTRLHHLNKVTINPTGYFGAYEYSTMVTLSYYNSNNGYAAASQISSWSAGSGVKILKPFDYYNTSLSNLSNSSFSGETIITDITPVAVINSSYFPDANFRGYILRQFPKGYITTNDVNATKNLNASGEYISNLQGLQYFSKLETFACEENIITSISSSLLPSTLKHLNCRANRLTSLPSLPSGLTTLICDNNQLTALPSYLPPSLQTLECENNKLSGEVNIRHLSSLKTLNISNNPNMITLNCDNNALTSFNVSGCTSLKTLDCNHNMLTSLDLTGCSSLSNLHCYDNQISSISPLPSTLVYFSAGKNKLSGTFSLTNRSALKGLALNENPYLTTINVTGNSTLYDFHAEDCTSLTTLNCYDNNSVNTNRLGIYISGCTKLTTLDCHNSYVSSSFVNDLPSSLQTLNCASNKLIGTFSLTGRSALKSLDISSNPSITTLNCYSNALTSLNVSGCSAMTTLICNNNQLTSLDVSSLSNLTELKCHYNKLTSLNVSNKTKLTTLYANANQLTSINVQGCSVLNDLNVECNKLTSLSVQGCNALRTINCCINKISASGANTLINSLCTIPSGSQGALRYIYPGYSSSSYVENNVNLTDAQVMSARNKRWVPYKYNGSSWVVIPAAVPGDVNGDGNVTSADITALYDVLLNNNYSHVVNGDQTGDGQITAADVTKVYTIMLGGQN